MIDNIGKLNAAVYRNLQSILNYKLRDIPIRGGQHDFLYVISKREGITQKELSQELYVDKSTTAKAVKSLVSLGYIRKEPSPDDKRFEKLYLTEKGQEIKAHIQNTFLEIVEIATKSLSAKEAEEAVRLLKVILDGLIEEKLCQLKKDE
ncbi:MarR family winged helix-turn-helix transcriptional regulator [Faecalicatena contorta]|uniref:DNA-binding transcriptional regulator, MarR family n=1 Tax=Faecalicatena contorta TaxID=39482 RepID=A0A315ZNE1_9FIRM|nr:MarR family winged helix-turn-helix transcriptional regulator [Faecalicatena contorta]PWJ47091.1 DNA-binding MarR family transcriptional regulator [Faecalicatena contorta]SUQ16192.1 DNA-binding transcriptional regulator, MarR family [Faecalicatena contorta]